MNLYSPKVIYDLLQRHGVATNKSLGQHFLLDKTALERIVGAAGLEGDETVLEIGPGLGVMTRMLAERAGRVVAVEVDSGFIRVLAETVGDLNNVIVAHSDFLKLNLPAFAEANLKPLPATVVANVPYNITTPILINLLETAPLWKTIVVLIQKEVAERISAHAGAEQYSSIGIHVQFHAEVECIAQVRASSFYPPPKVDSTIVRLRPRTTQPVDVRDAKMFSRVVRSAFSQRRKTLVNSLAAIPDWSKEAVRAGIDAAGIDPGRRGETLSMEEFATLANSLEDALASTEPAVA